MPVSAVNIAATSLAPILVSVVGGLSRVLHGFLEIGDWRRLLGRRVVPEFPFAVSQVADSDVEVGQHARRGDELSADVDYLASIRQR